jgi:hypothetical protein
MTEVAGLRKNVKLEFMQSSTSAVLKNLRKNSRMSTGIWIDGRFSAQDLGAA